MGTSYRHSGSILDIAFTYGQTISTTTDDEQQARVQYLGNNNEKHYYYGYSVPRQLVYILTGQQLSVGNQGFFFGHSRGWRCGRCCNTCSSSFWRVDRDPF